MEIRNGFSKAATISRNRNMLLSEISSLSLDWPVNFVDGVSSKSI